MDKTQIILLNIADGEDKSSPLGNRLRNKYKHLRKWAKRTQTDCFRIYDRDIPHFPLAIDYYAGHFCVQYFSPSKENDEPPSELVQETNQIIGSIFGVTFDYIHWRTRSKSKKTRQYEKLGDSNKFFNTTEYGVKFRVNLDDYLDTGLFLDHRETRQIVASCSRGKRLLNLFAYTCSFSVHAAVSGAIYTKSIDMSNTYTEWGKKNLILNSLSLKNHPIVRADCLKFLDEEILVGTKYDIVVIDPPTISRSKKMDQLFDIQIDYIPLILKSLKLISKGGIIFFSTNSRRFDFDKELFACCSIEEISHQTIPMDFPSSKIHRCWKIILD